MWAIDRQGTWQVVRNPIQVNIGDVNYPAAIFTAWTAEELLAIGIYPAVDVNAAAPSRWHFKTDETYALVNGTVEVTTVWTAPPLDDVKTDAIARLLSRRNFVQDQDFVYSGATYTGDERTRLAVLMEVIRAIYAEIHAQPYNVSFPTKDGIGTALDRNGVIAFADAMATNFESVQALAITKIAAVNAAADIATIQATLDSVGA